VSLSTSEVPAPLSEEEEVGGGDQLPRRIPEENKKVFRGFPIWDEEEDKKRKIIIRLKKKGATLTIDLGGVREEVGFIVVVCG
jgi:hypothetical protein